MTREILGYLYFKRLSSENLSLLKIHATIYGECILSSQIFLPKISKISPLKIAAGMFFFLSPLKIHLGTCLMYFKR